MYAQASLSQAPIDLQNQTQASVTIDPHRALKASLCQDSSNPYLTEILGKSGRPPPMDVLAQSVETERLTLAQLPRFLSNLIHLPITRLSCSFFP